MLKPTHTHIRLLTIALAASVLLHVTYLPAWVSVTILASYVWRERISSRGWKLPPLIVLVPITLVSSLGILLTYHTLFGRDAGVALLTLMLSLKLLETESKRDLMLVTLAGYFLTISGFLFDQSLLTGLLACLPTFLLTMTLLSISHPTKWQSIPLQIRLTGQLLVQSIPVMLLLFILFPRIPGPLWGLPDQHSSKTGLSDSMEPGNISQLIRSGETAFRVSFADTPPDKKLLYWRGPVFWHYDGKTWSMTSESLMLPPEMVEFQQSPVSYTLTLEPHQQKWLLALEAVDLSASQDLPPESRLTHDHQLIAKQAISQRLRYSLVSYPHYQLGRELDKRAKELAVQVNDDENPKTFAWVQAIKKGTSDPQSIIKQVLQHFRDDDFYYTLSPPRLSIKNSIDDFLFSTKRGFCEHYASSFVFMMRAAGIPARVVTGYQGGEYNIKGKYMIVRQSDAHAWAEVWLENQGWVRVDPTAAVSPSRIEQGIASSIDDLGALPLFSRQESTLLKSLYLNWDAVNNRWNQWVLGYNQEKQLQLMTRLFGKDADYQTMIITMMAGLSLFGILLTSYLFLQRRNITSPTQLAYQQLKRQLQKAGMQVPEAYGPLTLLEEASNHWPEHAPHFERIIQCYNRLQYANSADANTLNQLKQAVNTLPKLATLRRKS